LKAIGLLRLITEQLPAAIARGFWRGDTFHLNSTLTESDTCSFLLEVYSPTPLVTPWNGGSGFYPKDQKKGVEAISLSHAARFTSYREALNQARTLIGERTESPKEEEKFALLRRAKQTWRGALGDWLAAALVLDSAGEPVYPAILGTGGNDGRLDFANNFMQRLAEMFDMTSAEGNATVLAEQHLRESLFDDPIIGLQDVAIGQFDPGAAGGMNSSVGFATSSAVNLWDFVLMLEGTIAFAPALARRANADGLNAAKPAAGLPQASAPFAVFSAAAGFATAVGDEKSRGEQWMPIWERPTTYAEFKQMLGQARCRVAGAPAKRPRDIAKAIARAGITKGFSGFERYGFLERNGQANLATPLGRWDVGRPNDKAYLLDEIEEWFSRFDRAASTSTAPESWKRQARVIDNAIMNCCRPGNMPSVWAELAVALGNAEAVILRNPNAAAENRLRPLFAGNRPLSPGWIEAIADRSVEVRLAASLACQFGPRKGPHFNLVPDAEDSIRRHFAPLAAKNDKVLNPPRFSASEDRLLSSNDVVVNDFDVVGSLARIVERRLLMLNRRNDMHYFPVIPTHGLEANVGDVVDWIDGRVDAVRMISLARFLTAVNWNMTWQLRRQLQNALGMAAKRKSDVLPHVRRHSGWAMTRLCFHWEDVQVEVVDDGGGRRKIGTRIPCDANIFAQLMADDPRHAVRIASQRLQGCGVQAKLNSVIVPNGIARRWASSIAWSLSPATMTLIASALLNLSSIQASADDDENPGSEIEAVVHESQSDESNLFL
jgi:CRISPR-associated protein Csx17